MSVETLNERQARLLEQQSVVDELAAKGINEMFFSILTVMKNDPRFEGLPLHFLKDMLSKSMTAGVRPLDPQTIDQLEPIDDTATSR